MDRYEMIPVAFTRSGFEAKVIAAQLGSEGVVWELRGDVDGLYPVGGIEVLVPSEEAALARDVLAAARDEGGNEAAGSFTSASRRRPRPAVAVAALALVVGFVAVRLLAMG